MRSIFILVCLLAVFTQLSAQECQKEYEKSFPKEGIEEVVLTNNYGKIEIVQTEESEIEESETESIEETFEEFSETDVRKESEAATEEISNNSESTENTGEPHKYGVIIILCALAAGVLLGRNIIGKITMK